MKKVGASVIQEVRSWVLLALSLDERPDLDHDFTDVSIRLMSEPSLQLKVQVERPRGSGND